MGRGPSVRLRLSHLSLKSKATSNGAAGPVFQWRGASMGLHGGEGKPGCAVRRRSRGACRVEAESQTSLPVAAASARQHDTRLESLSLPGSCFARCCA